MFTVQSYFHSLYSGLIHSFPASLVWQSMAPTKFFFSPLDGRVGKSLTQDNLQQRGFLLTNHSVRCKVVARAVNHLFLHCCVARLS